MLFLIIEHFKNGDAAPVYKRFRERGRLAPPGLTYINSWITTDFTRCYQIMDCTNRALLDEWFGYWSDLIDFEVLPVVTSAEVQETMAKKT